MRECQLSLPINLEKIIANDDEVFTLEEICEELDFSSLKRKFRIGIYDPVTMFKVIVYGYMCHIYSSRGIEKACRRDIHFMWRLTECLFRTITRLPDSEKQFRKKQRNCFIR